MWTFEKERLTIGGNHGSSTQNRQTPTIHGQYTAEFKREAVGLVTDGGLSMAQVARDLGLDDNLVSRWKKEAQQNGQHAFSGQGHPQEEELARLRRENDVLRQEREILKKAISIFSATTR